MPKTKEAEALLRACHAGAEVSSEFAFCKALDQVRLDYTRESLGRIDQLLRQMHRQLAPTLDAFVVDPARRKFLLLLCYYIGTVVARQTQLRLEWYADGELASVLPPSDRQEIPGGFASSAVAVLWREERLGSVFFPLATIQDILFGGNTKASVVGRVGEYVRGAADEVPSQPAPPARIAEPAPLAAVIAAKPQRPLDGQGGGAAVAVLGAKASGAAEKPSAPADGESRNRRGTDWLGAKERLTPHCVGLLNVIAFAYAWWAAASFHAGSIRGQEGPGVMAMYLILVAVFVITFAIVGVVLGRIATLIGNSAPVFLLLPAGVFLLGYGLPSLVALPIGAVIYVFAALAARRTGEDADNIEDFLRDKSATEVDPSEQYLRRFSSPLWDKVDLELCKPLKIIEGQEGSYAFTVIEMRHSAFGLFSDNGQRAVTTFFIVAIPDQSERSWITWQPKGYQVSVDKNHVYLAAPGRKERHGNWENLLRQTIQTADSLQDATPGRGSSDDSRRTYRPVGLGALAHGFWALVFLVVSVVSVVFGLGAIFGLIKVPMDGTGRLGHALQALFLAAFSFGGFLYYMQRVRKRL